MSSVSSTSKWLGCLVPVACLVPIMAFLALWQFLSPERPSATIVAFSDFMTELRADPEREPHVESVSIRGQEITYWSKDPRARSMTKRATIGPPDARDLLRDLSERHVAVTFEEPEPPGSSGAFGVILLGFAGAIIGGVALALLVLARMDLARTQERLLQAEAEIARLTGERPA